MAGEFDQGMVSSTVRDITSGYEKPRLRPSSNARSLQHLGIIFRVFLTLLISTVLGCSLSHYFSANDPLDTSYLSMYLSGFCTVWLSVLAYRRPSNKPIGLGRLFWITWILGIVTHIYTVLCHVPSAAPNPRNRNPPPLCGLILNSPGGCISDDSDSESKFGDFGHDSSSSFTSPSCFAVACGSENPPCENDGDGFRCNISQPRIYGPAFRFRGGCGSDDSSSEVEDHYPPVSHGPAFRFRGGCTSDDSSSEPDDDTSKRKRKANGKVKPRKRASTSTNKGKGKAADSDSDAEQGIRVTAKSERRRTGGMFVDEVIPITLVPESWDVPAATNRVAYILDLSGTPKLLQSGRKTLTVDAFIKKEVFEFSLSIFGSIPDNIQCQDSFTGPTGSKSDRSLAKVMILNDDSDEPVLCRRSTLTCSGCYKCTLASDDFLEDCRRWDDTDAPHSLISAPIMTAKASEANSVAAIASAFYRGVVETYCKGQHLDSDIPCGGRAILRKFSQGKMNGKTYFIGCSNWAHGDSAQMSKIHRFVPIPSAVRESILVKLFKGEPIDDEDNDTEVLAGSCMQIIHPSHLPKNSVCPRNHYHDGVHVVAKLKKHECRAQLSILVPINDKDLRAVIIPAAGVPHNHPSFTRTKIPAEVKMKYQQCIDAAGPVGMTTLRIDKSSSTHSILAGRLPQELHPGMINSRKRRDMVKDTRETMYRLASVPAGKTRVRGSVRVEEFERHVESKPI
ncbi:hypothetical protein B0H10DRAFT_1952502 [Mycena sp. CBHHK59/15]|nr:hypothetical protein B0H10DRAFT_1952502 [Mycena sp. CBHHK59/15]